MEDALRSLGLVLFTCLALAACSTQRQTVGTAAGVAAGVVVAGPVGAVVGGAVGAVATAPGYCYYRNRWGRLRRGRGCSGRRSSLAGKPKPSVSIQAAARGP